MKVHSLVALALTVITLNAFGAESQVVIPKAVLDRHAAACPEFSSERGEYMTKEAYVLPGSEYSPASTTLYVIGCDLYAYNSMEKAYIVNSYGDITNVAIAEVGADKSISATTDLMGAGFDPISLTLGTFQKGRGVGDCGSTATYKYESSLEKFVLIEARSKAECDGDIEAEWPVVYSK